MAFAPTGPTVAVTGSTAGVTGSISGFVNTQDATARIFNAGAGIAWVGFTTSLPYTPAQTAIPFAPGYTDVIGIGAVQPIYVGVTTSTGTAAVFVTPGKGGGA